MMRYDLTAKAFLLLSVTLFFPFGTNQAHSFEYDDKGRRDPMWELVTDDGSLQNFEKEYMLTDLALEGIIMSATPGQSLAIINGKILKEKDEIGEFSILKIETKEVTLRRGSQEFRLYLK